MGMNSIRRFAPLLAIVCAAALAPAAHAASQGGAWGKTPCDTKPHANDIDVGTSVSCKLAVVSKADASQNVRWQAVDQQMNVKIEFAWPNPFVHMTNCDGTHRMCVMDTPGAPGDEQKVYLYTASLCDKNGVCTVVTDPGIIINP